MRILHTADWHLGKHLDGASRLEEQEAFLADFIALTQDQKIDLIIIAGDVYDASNPPSKAEALFYDTLKALSKDGERMTIVVSGNHDSPERLVAAGPLARDHGIVMVGTPKTVIETGKYGQNEIIASGEGFIEVEINGERAVILTVPYPSEKRLNEILYKDGDSDAERLTSYTDRITELFQTLGAHFRVDTINLVVSHLFAMGSVEAGSERSIQLGGSYIIDGSCFPKEAQYIALGHVHKPQFVPGTDKRARYSGSPLHYNKKEISSAKQCLLVELTPGAVAKVTELPIPIYKPIEIWKCKGVAEAIAMVALNSERSCWVYLEIETDVYIREDEIKQIKSLKKDVLEILPILTTVTSTAEAEQMQAFAEKTFPEHFQDFYLKERGLAPTEDLVHYLLTILEEVSE